MSSTDTATAADTIAAPEPHPRIVARREEVADDNQRKRTRRAMVGGVLVLLAVLAWAATRSPLLDVDEVRVLGATELSAETVRGVAGVEPGQPLIGLRMSVAEDELAQLPAIAEASVTRTWGGLVTIEVVERVGVASFVVPDGGLVVAADGVVLASTAEVDESHPRVLGAMFSADVGDVVPVEVREVLTVAAALPPDLASLTDQIELSVDRVVLRLRGGAVVDLGDARSLGDKMTAIRTVVDQVDLRCLDELNVAAPLVPVVTRLASC